MSRVVRLIALIGALVLASGAPAYARAGGGGGGGHVGGGGGHFAGGGAHAGGGHAFGGPHGAGHFDGHHGFDGHHHGFRGGAFVGVGPYWGPDWDPYWGYSPYGPYAYAPPSVAPPAVYIEKPQAGYCPSGQENYPGMQSCAQPWMHAAPNAG